MSASPPQKLSLWNLTALVVGSMLGAWVFSMPQGFARVTGLFGAILGWMLVGGGMLMLALVFQTLAQRKPQLDAGVYSYAQAGFGDYMGFSSALGYWAGSCMGNVAYFVLMKATLAAIIPAFGDGNSVSAVLVSSIMLWTIHFIILRGVKKAAVINTVATGAKIIPIFLFIVFVAFGFKADMFAANFWGEETFSWKGIFDQLRGTVLAMVFVFLGIEGASVYSRYAKRRQDVGIATILGFVGVLCMLILVTILSFGVMPQSEMAALRDPSMAGVLQAVVGPWGAVFVSVGLLISVLGAYLSWSLLTAEVLFSAAHTKVMPAFLGRENKNKVPAAALWLTNILVQFFLLLTLLTEKPFTLAKELTTSMTLIPYLLVAGYGLQLAWIGESYSGNERARRRDLVISGVAVAFAIVLVGAGGLRYLVLSAAVYGPGTILFVIARREQGKRIFTPGEWLIFLMSAMSAILAVYGMVSGFFTI